MANKDVSPKLTMQDLVHAFSDATWAARFPPILSTEQVAELFQVPKQTIYDWSSRGLFKGCCRKFGKHLRFLRDKLLLKIFNEGLDNDGE